MRIVLLLVLMFCVACSTDNAPPMNQQSSDLGDAVSREDGSTVLDMDFGEDTLPDSAFVLPSCNGTVALNSTIDLNAAGEGGQLYARTAWDGSGAWVTWAGPAADGEPESVFVARADCKGALDIVPQQVSPGGTDRHLQPVVASAEGFTVVVWFSQDELGATAIWSATFDQTGQVRSAATEVTPLANGIPVSNLIWNPDVTVVDENQAAITFAYGTVDGFKVGVQRIGADGARSGDFFVPVDDGLAEQTMPSIGSNPDGTLRLSWIRGSDTADDQAMLVQIPVGAIVGDPPNGIPAKPLTTPNPLGRVSKGLSASGNSFMAFQVTNAQRSDILIRSASDLSTVESLTLGTPNFNNFRASVAAGDNGGVVAWYRYTQSPLQNQIVLQAFNDTLVAGGETTIEMSSNGIAPFGPDVSFVENGVYFVVWSEGAQGSEAKVKGRFIRLTMP